MAKGKNVTVTSMKVNNSKASTTISKVVEPIVVNGQLVIDDRETDPGVFTSNK